MADIFSFEPFVLAEDFMLTVTDLNLASPLLPAMMGNGLPRAAIGIGMWTIRAFTMSFASGSAPERKVVSISRMQIWIILRIMVVLLMNMAIIWKNDWNGSISVMLRYANFMLTSYEAIYSICAR